MLRDVQRLLQAITQQHPVGQICQPVVRAIVARLLLERARLRSQLAGLVNDQSACLVGDHRAYILPPHGEEKGHAIEQPQRLVGLLCLDHPGEADTAG